MIQHLCPPILFGGFILASYFAYSHIRNKDWKHRETRIFIFFSICSAIWSLGFFGVFVQTVPENAYLWRAIGMAGTFGYLITAQLLVCHFSGIGKIWRIFVESFSMLGIVIYFFVIQKKETTFLYTDKGMTYSFTPGLWNNLYIIYSVIIAINIFSVTTYMFRRASSQRMKVLAKKLFTAEATILFGMILDTILPLLGINAIPGSTLAQILGLFVVYNTIAYASHSQINIRNMSEFIYYSLTVPVLVYDSNYYLQLVNDTGYSFVGIDKNKKDNFDIKGIDTLFRTDKGNIFDFEDKFQEADAICCHNQSYCSLSVNKIYDEYNDVIGYIIIVTDLSERMKALKKLEEAKKDAENANQAKSLFLANMSHEIRTPMNAITGFSELLLKMNINDEARDYVTDIKFASQNLLAIINDILDITKIESGKMELVVDSYFTSKLLTDVCLIISPQAEQKGLLFQTNIDENIPKCLYGDKVRIKSILINILNNAVKYTQEGSISFDVSIQKQEENKITLEFKISDTGIGIKEENMQNLFKNFERFDQKVHYGIEGSGLGLAISNGYISLMGGTITVHSNYGQGSTFIITLEQKIIDPNPLEDAYNFTRPIHDTGTITNMKAYGVSVLVVDDNIINLRVAHGILSYYGLVVDTASSGMESIELCQNKNYDFVFMDQMMPEIDGIEAMKEIRRINAHYGYGGDGKIIVLTANAIKGTRKQLINEGFDEYLGKPINIAQLERLLLRFVPAHKITYEETEEEQVEESTDSSQMSMIRSTLSTLDIDSGILNCGGTIDDYLKILKITYDFGNKQLEELLNTFHQKDYENYIIKIHSLKSTLLNIGATKLSAMARRQEEEGRAGNLQYIDSHVETFQMEYRQLLDKLEIVLTHYHLLDSTTNEEELEMITLDDTMLTRIYQNIERQIDNFEFGKVFDILDELSKYKIPEKHRETFVQIETLMNDLAVDEIRAILTQVTHA